MRCSGGVIGLALNHVNPYVPDEHIVGVRRETLASRTA